MACKKEKPSKSILKIDHETGPSLGAYNLYAKRASFKDDVIFQQILVDKAEEPVITPPVIQQHLPIAPDETEEELSPEERRKREEFKAKRRMLALEGADGLDLKAVLAHRISLVDGVEEEDEPEWAETTRPHGLRPVAMANSMDQLETEDNGNGDDDEESENQLINSMGEISCTVPNTVNMIPNPGPDKANQ
ncbi:hypothetical protein D915_000208 [Fasciola hepatica]|uniref:Uncharacterized protein n=1 Tax=Fasciola hepatica TaxID=6192 RepID=A0A4E0RIZ7_FASHE|nr:hypothetical protein D915_000208 [Fasciola hepatica]